MWVFAAARNGRTGEWSYSTSHLPSKEFWTSGVTNAVLHQTQNSNFNIGRFMGNNTTPHRPKQRQIAQIASEYVLSFIYVFFLCFCCVALCFVLNINYQKYMKWVFFFCSLVNMHHTSCCRAYISAKTVERVLYVRRTYVYGRCALHWISLWVSVLRVRYYSCAVAPLAARLSYSDAHIFYALFHSNNNNNNNQITMCSYFS